jgi:hypothetical protein
MAMESYVNVNFRGKWFLMYKKVMAVIRQVECRDKQGWKR